MSSDPIWRIEYEFQTQEQHQFGAASSTVIAVRYPRAKGAVAASAAFWKNRHAAFPDHFHRCCAVVVSQLDPSPLNEDGSLSGSGTRRVFEWKLITGCGPGVTSRFSGELTSLPFSATGDPYNDSHDPSVMDFAKIEEDENA